MRKTLTRVLPIMALVGLPGVPAMAMDLGEFEFNNSCAQCHGASATGDGLMAQYLNVAVPDLTQLAKANGGVFPVKRMYDYIDGSADLGAHGREMPIWGTRYMVDAFEAADDPKADFPFDPMDPMGGHQSYVRTRILSLIEYIASLQAE